MNDHNQISPLTVRHRIGYALGDFGGCMTFGLMTAFTTRYYINVALIDTAVISVMTLIWKLFDALANPFVGVMLDKSFAASGGKRDKFRPWILRMAPMLSVCAILVFTAPGWVDGMGRIVVAFTTYLMYDAAAAVQYVGTILGIKALSLLFQALCALGSWLVFRFVWNITPELREKMAKACQA